DVSPVHLDGGTDVVERRLEQLHVDLAVRPLGGGDVNRRFLGGGLCHVGHNNNRGRCRVPVRLVVPADSGTHAQMLALHVLGGPQLVGGPDEHRDRKSTRLNSSHVKISYAVFCLKKKKKKHIN